MAQLIRGCNPKTSLLAEPLKRILGEGIAYRDGCLVLKTQLELTQLNARKRFQDETGYESFVNHIHLEDTIASADVCVLLEQALVFADELATLTSKAGIKEPLEYIVISDENDVNVRFHIRRPGQSWLADDLETYEEAVAAVQLPNRADHDTQ